MHLLLWHLCSHLPPALAGGLNLGLFLVCFPFPASSSPPPSSAASFSPPSSPRPALCGTRGTCPSSWARSVPGAARTILLFDTISASPSKQPRMVGCTLGIYSFGLIFVSARTNKRHHHPVPAPALPTPSPSPTHPRPPLPPRRACAGLGGSAPRVAGAGRPGSRGRRGSP
jgi:hypothetical protein